MNEMLLLMIPVPSPHRLLSTCNMPCMKNNLQTKILVLFVDNPPILISGHTPIIYFVEYPLIYNSGNTPIIYCVDNPPIYNSGHTRIIYCVDNPPIYNFLTYSNKTTLFKSHVRQLPIIHATFFYPYIETNINTKHNVDFPMHSHPFNAMYLRINAM